MLEDIAGSRKFSTVSPDCHVLSVNLLSSVKSTGHQWRICQSWCSLANAKHPARCWVVKHNPHLWTLGPHTTLMESVPDRLSRHLWPAGGNFAGLWQSSSCSSLHKGGGSEPAAGLLPSNAFSTSPDVLACLLVAPPCSGHYADRHSKPSCHSSH